jgi:SAM-dependent methyltransferase
MVAIVGFSREQILSAVRKMYTDVATFPAKQFHFPTGRAACVFVGYPEDWLDCIPATAVESFAGVGFPFRADVIRPGDRVLDVGAGSGTDTLTAARLAGPQGKVFALDMTQAMLAKLRGNATQADPKAGSPLIVIATALSVPYRSIPLSLPSRTALSRARSPAFSTPAGQP